MVHIFFLLFQAEKFSRKRKAPTPRANPVSKRALLEASEALLSLQDATFPQVPQTNETDASQTPVKHNSAKVVYLFHILYKHGV